MCLQRETPAGILLPQRAEKTVGSSSRPSMPGKDVTILGPGNMDLPLRREEGEEASMSEQLKAMQVSKEKR